MTLPTYYVKEMYVGFKDSPNRHLEFSMTKAVGALEPRRHQQLLSGEYQDHLRFPFTSKLDARRIKHYDY